jgi:hypothetical protein
MRRYLLDSGVLNDYVRRRSDVVDRVKDATNRGIRVGTATPVVAELFGGAENSDSREKSLDRLRHALAPMVAWPFERPAGAPMRLSGFAAGCFADAKTGVLAQFVPVATNSDHPPNSFISCFRGTKFAKDSSKSPAAFIEILSARPIAKALVPLDLFNVGAFAIREDRIQSQHFAKERFHIRRKRVQTMH